MAAVLQRVCEENLGGVKLKKEQEQAVLALLEKKDVFAVLPTGFGKSLIYQSYSVAKSVADDVEPAVIVVVPLRSIAEEQVKSNEFDLKAAQLSLDKEKLRAVASGEVRVLYASAEEVLHDSFLDLLKQEDSPFRQNLSLIVVDESHTVYTWGKENKKGKTSMKPFREKYGALSQLRSFCSGIPILALTGTADSKMAKIIKQQLALQKDCLSIVVSPERFNIRLSVINSTRQVYMNHFQWIVDMVIENGLQTPKTIIFCNSLKDVALMVSFLFEKLGSKLYPAEQPEVPVNRLIGMYHSHTLQKYKDRVVDAFKYSNGNMRVIVATSALSMGVNFPDVVYVVHAGPPRALVDHIQEAGRAGRNGNKAHDITIYHGQQLAQCETRVKEFVKADDCLRMKLYGAFHSATKPLEPLHDCCSNCSADCSCGLPDCNGELPFTKPCGNVVEKQHSLKRDVSIESKEVLRHALVDLKSQFDMGQFSVFNSVSTHGFSESLIDSIVTNCEFIFTLGDLMDDFPVYSVAHGVAILEVLDELFEDIPGVEELLEIVKYFENESSSDLPNFDLFTFTDHFDNESDSDST